MLGSHYDGHDISQGAQDPASGAVSVMETARLLAKHAGKLPCTLRFALWGVEEIGLLGSYEYARRHEADLGRFRFYFNMDAAGAVPNKGVNLNEWPELETLIQEWQKDIAFAFQIQQKTHAHSDHYPFLLKGMPTGGLEPVPRTADGRGYGHTAYDTLDKVTNRELQDAAFLASIMAHRIAAVPAAEWPLKHRTAEEVDALFALPEYTEVAELDKRIEAYYDAAA